MGLQRNCPTDPQIIDLLHRRRFSFAIIFHSRPFHSKLDFGKPTQKSDRWEANVRTDKLVLEKILSQMFYSLISSHDLFTTLQPLITIFGGVPEVPKIHRK